MLRPRTLYQVRVHVHGLVFGKTVGFKARLLPRRVSARVQRRLQRCGLHITISAMQVYVTEAQQHYLKRRYSAKP